MEIETERKENDWEHRFCVEVLGDKIEVVMNDTDRGNLDVEWEEDGWEISAGHWYGDGDRLPHKICFSAELTLPEEICEHCCQQVEEERWITADIEVELSGAWESNESNARVEVNMHEDDYEGEAPTDGAVGIASYIREACYRIYSEKRECALPPSGV